MTKKRKRDPSAVMPEAVAEQPQPAPTIHIVDLDSPTWTMLCGASGDGPNEGSTLKELHVRATCQACLTKLLAL